MISTLTGDANSQIRNKYSVKEPYVPGIDVFCQNVLSVTCGQIVYVGQDTTGRYSVSVKVNHNEVLRYTHLKNCQFEAGHEIFPNVKLGDADKYVRFEYCTSWKGASLFPVHINNYTFYKQDPTDILEGRYLPEANFGLTSQLPIGKVSVEYTSTTQQSEFAVDNRGE